MNEQGLAALLAAAVPGSATGPKADAIIGVLRDAIVRGDLPPGMALRQDRIAQAIGISKIPLREVLARLETEGFVISSPGRGVVVAQVRPEQVEEIFQLRNMLEERLLADAIPRMTPESLDLAQAAIDDFETAPTVELGRVNWRFHSALYAPSGRSLSLEILRGLYLHADRYVQLHMSAMDHDRTSNEDHRRLLAACRAGRTGEACGILRDPLHSIGQTICDYAALQIAAQAEQDRTNP